MVRRKRSLAVATASVEEGSSSSPRHALSPKSLGTIDSSVGEHSNYTTNAGSTVGPDRSFVGSLIGHDDPTLLHANIQEWTSSGINESATLESFLTTEAASDEIRDSSHTSGSAFSLSERQAGPRAMSDSEYLERELNKLDQTQEEWKARHQEEQAKSVSGHEMDSTGDFYMDEVGGFHQASPRRSRVLNLQEQTIVEEEEFLDESSRDQSMANQTSSPEKSIDDPPRTGNFVMALSENVVASASAASSVMESVASDLVFEYPSTEESDGRGTPTRHMSNVVESHVVDEFAHDEEKGENMDDVVRHVQRRLTDNIAYNDTINGTELQFQDQGDSVGGERMEPPSDQRKKGFRRWIPVGDDSERSRSWFQPRPRSLAAKSDSDGVGIFADEDVNDDGNVRKRRRKLCCLNICLCLLIIAAIVCSVLFALEFFVHDESTGSERSPNVVAPTTSSPVEKPTFSLPAATLQPSVGIPSQSPPSVAPIASNTEEQGRVDGEGNLSENSGNLTTLSPEDEADASVTAPAQSVDASAPTNNPDEQADANLAITSPPSSENSTSRSAEERIVAISGGTLYDPDTPQYAAYDWLQNKDPAKLDLDNVSEQTLSQRYVAALFYFALGGENWVDKYGFLGASDVCEWNNGSPRSKMGIVCDNAGIVEGSRVTKSSPITGIVLNENNLVGRLPSELEALNSLETLQLRSNNIEGELPAQLGNCTLLQEIDLRENELHGTVPESIFNLPEIRSILLLRNYRLGGTIPSSIDKASKLEMLSFQKCQLTGTIPTQLGQLSNLFFITFMENSLTGFIPPGVTQLPNLEVLELSGNQLQGPIPKFNLQPELYFVSLFDNQLTGSIPVSLVSLPGLLFLDIQNNLLTGSIPRIIGRLPELVTFSAQNNQLTGNLPSFSGNNGMLQSINLASNNLSGNLNAFFDSNGPTDRLFTVDLSSNKFIGSIPPSIGDYVALKDILLENNALTGSIPIEIGNLQYMDTLVLHQNNLSNTLPEEIGMAASLVHLDVSFNKLTGTIPDTMIMLPELEVLDLESNQFDGSIPSSFSLLSNLSELYLQGNNIHGDLSSTFCSASQPLGTFVSDCLGPAPQVTCSCCSTCCNGSDCQQNN